MGAICGFCGFEDRGLLFRMIDLIKHRGPERRLTYLNSEVALAELGLYPDTGREVSCNGDKTIYVVWGGFLRNFKDLKKLVEGKGHNLVSGRESEVIACLYEEYGEEAVTRLRGNFGLAVWDSRTKKLVLARDQIGAKPLFYAHLKDKIAFATELKALLAWKDIHRCLDAEAVEDYLTFGFVPAPKTMIPQIKKVPGATLLAVKGEHQTSSRYWEPPSSIDVSGKDTDDYAAIFKEMFEDSIRLRLTEDGPVAAMLSGGMDSSSVVAMLSRVVENHRPIHTFTVGYADYTEWNEFKYARIVSDHFSSHHHEIKVSANDVISSLDKVVWAMDEPFFDTAVLPAYQTHKAVSQVTKTLFCGEGADILLAGSGMYSRMKKHDELIKQFKRYNALPDILKWVIKNIIVKYTGKLERFVRVAEIDLDDVELFLMDNFGETPFNLCAMTPQLKSELYTSDFKAQLKDYDYREQIRPFMLKGRELKLDYGNRASLLRLAIEFPDANLTKEERMSASWGLDLKIPFIDPDMVEAFFSLPSSIKLPEYQSKAILHRAMKEMLPGEILHRKKAGLRTPIHRWLKSEIKEMAQEIILGSSKRGWFKASMLEKMYQEHISDTADRTPQLAALLFLETWCRLFIDDSIRYPEPI